ncbi:DNA-processing protein DprA [Marinospirillum sp. MEB164]|uniref:DNA-processing protein DprA n=1 Tax=Marinospirillum alkalitolerans TaxID=3123374 RepID=A0ABW8PWR2_9GAMM
MSRFMDEPSLALCLALRSVPGLGTRRLVRLVQDQNYLTPQDVAEQLLRLPRLGQAQRQMLRLALDHPQQHPQTAHYAAQLEWAAQADQTLLTYWDLPPHLQALPDAPWLLFVRGSVEALWQPAVAIVGTRQPSAEGEQLAFAWSCALAQQGLNMISGLAKGIDGAAHRGALLAQQQGAASQTLAVLAHGLDQVYPAQHQALAAQIVAEQGALISEYELGTPPLARHFPARNRLITGLALGLVVIEAQQKSGSLVSARLALEQGREVMAAPGALSSERSSGCHQLIRQGATLVTEPAEILLQLAPALTALLDSPAEPSPSLPHPKAPPAFAAPIQPASLHPEEAQVYAELQAQPLHLETLQERLALPVGQLLMLLQSLELQGLAESLHQGWRLKT